METGYHEAYLSCPSKAGKRSRSPNIQQKNSTDYSKSNHLIKANITDEVLGDNLEQDESPWQALKRLRVDERENNAIVSNAIGNSIKQPIAKESAHFTRDSCQLAQPRSYSSNIQALGSETMNQYSNVNNVLRALHEERVTREHISNVYGNVSNTRTASVHNAAGTYSQIELNSPRTYHAFEKQRQQQSIFPTVNSVHSINGVKTMLHHQTYSKFSNNDHEWSLHRNHQDIQQLNGCQETPVGILGVQEAINHLQKHRLPDEKDPADYHHDTKLASLSLTSPRKRKIVRLFTDSKLG